MGKDEPTATLDPDGKDRALVEVSSHSGSANESHTCEHLLIAVKLPAGHPPGAPIPWDTDPKLAALHRGVDTDVIVSEVR